jgi:hypothetical protein
MPARSCDVCGKSYQAQRSTSKYCSSACRARRSLGAQPIALKVRPPEAGPIAHHTRAELEAIGRLETALGQVVLALAKRLDAADNEPGTAMASLAREHRTALEVATRGAHRAADPLDQLKTRRDYKRAG